MTQLGFEDFLEMLCRIAASKATPTDGEVAQLQAADAAERLEAPPQQQADDSDDEAQQQSGKLLLSCEDGGEYMQRMSEDPTDFDAFVASHEQPFIESIERPSQPVHRALDHLLAFILRKVIGKPRGACDLHVDAKEAKAFVKRA